MTKARLFSIALAILICAASVVRGGTTLRLDQAIQLRQLDIELQKQFKAKDYAKASDACRKIIGIIPSHPGPHYFLARALARLGKADEALGELETAVKNGYKGVEMLQKEEDLSGLHEDKRFAECVKKINENERGVGAAYEKGAEIAGVKTLEADPEAGFRYRLRMSPTATAKKPNRLILWLHPAGESGNQNVEPLSKRFNSLGYALLVLTQKDWKTWSPLDTKRVTEGTVADVAKTPGIDAERPIVMGMGMGAIVGPGTATFAGGQAALSMWQAAPGKIGGVVLDAAYPVRMKPGGASDTIPLLENIAIQATPFFVIVGQQDSRSQVWRDTEPAWRQVGVPLTVYYLAGKDQGWLFGDKEMDSLCAWLKEVRAGKLPSGPPAAETTPKKDPKKK